MKKYTPLSLKKARYCFKLINDISDFRKRTELPHNEFEIKLDISSLIIMEKEVRKILKEQGINLRKKRNEFYIIVKIIPGN